MTKPTIIGIKKPSDNPPEQEPQIQEERDAIKPNPEPAGEQQNLYRPVRRGDDSPVSPKAPRATFKSLPKLDKVVGADGEIFNQGDTIRVRSYLGSFTTGIIQGFYEDANGQAWAIFHNPDIEMGCIQAGCLKRAVTS